VQTVTGVLIAVLSWLILWSLGVPSPIFWAFIIFVTSYVPIVGGVVGVIFPVLFSLAVSENLSTPLLLLVLLQLIQIVVGYVVQPRMQSHSMNIDAIVVLLSLALWSVLLGPVGAFLSTPLTVTAMVVLSQFPRTMWLAILLSADSRPVPAEVTQEAGKENN
jgi:predicted PurR-regulated permease PerM